LGWATFPDDGDNALALYRAADERLYARRIFSSYEGLNAEAGITGSPTSEVELRGRP